MELIYVKTRVKGPGSPELASNRNGKISEILQIFMHLVQAYINVFMYFTDSYKIC